MLRLVRRAGILAWTWVTTTLEELIFGMLGQFQDPSTSVFPRRTTHFFISSNKKRKKLLGAPGRTTRSKNATSNKK